MIFNKNQIYLVILIVLSSCFYEEIISYRIEEENTNPSESAEVDVIEIVDNNSFNIPELSEVIIRNPIKIASIDITTPSQASTLSDVVFLVDQSGSYGDDLVTFKNLSLNILNEFKNFSNSVKYGLTGFCDSGCGVYTFYQDLTDNDSLFQTKLSPLTAAGGGDVPESQLDGLYNTSQDITWRQGSLRVIFLATDATFANPGRTYSFSQVLSELNEKNIIVFGLSSGVSTSDLDNISTETGGQVLLLSSDSSGVVEKVSDAVDSINKTFKISLDSGVGSRYIKSITPTTITIDSGSGSKVTFNVEIFWENLILDGYGAVRFKTYIKSEYNSYIYVQPIILYL